MSLRRAAWWWSVGVLLASCQLESQLRPRTQVVVDVGADPQVLAASAHVQLTVTGGGPGDDLFAAPSEVDQRITLGEAKSPSWPLRVVLQPRSADSARRFSVHVSAFDSQDRVVTEVRARSGYVAGEVRWLQLRLVAACMGVSCSAADSCAAGACRDAWLEPNDLPLYVPARDAGPAHGDAAPALPPDASATAPKEDAAAEDAGALGIISGRVASSCEIEHGGCDLLVSCQVAAGGVAVCGACPSGYDDVNGDGTQCRDRDECRTDNGGCDAKHGRCVNTPGRRECSCEEGFHGDGVQCSNNVLCGPGGMCSQDASCQDMAGLRVCMCKPGLDGDGASCADIDECALKLDDCDHTPNACVNDRGGFHCLCPAGYSGDGRGDSGCRDNDECKDAKDNCDHAPDACVNDPGTFHCACPAGYSGDGQGADGCKDVDECSTNKDDCSSTPDACVNDVGGFHCNCPAGYKGDGRGASGCVDIDECATDSGGCDPMRQCVNTPGGAHCGACPAGYGTAGASGCNLCACYQHGGDKACAANRTSVPAAATTAFADSRMIAAGTLVAFRVSLPANTRITGFGAFKTGDAQAPFAMGLYDDAAGLPGTRISRSDATVFDSHQLSLPAHNEFMDCLASGNYWLVGLANNDLSLGQDTGGSVPFATVRLGTSSSPGLPLRWPGNTATTAPQLNMYVTFDQP